MDGTDVIPRWWSIDLVWIYLIWRHVDGYGRFGFGIATIEWTTGDKGFVLCNVKIKSVCFRISTYYHGLSYMTFLISSVEMGIMAVAEGRDGRYGRVQDRPLFGSPRVLRWLASHEWSPYTSKHAIYRPRPSFFLWWRKLMLRCAWWHRNIPNAMAKISSRVNRLTRCILIHHCCVCQWQCTRKRIFRYLRHDENTPADSWLVLQRQGWE